MSPLSRRDSPKWLLSNHEVSYPKKPSSQVSWSSRRVEQSNFQQKLAGVCWCIFFGRPLYNLYRYHPADIFWILASPGSAWSSQWFEAPESWEITWRLAPGKTVGMWRLAPKNSQKAITSPARNTVWPRVRKPSKDASDPTGLTGTVSHPIRQVTIMHMPSHAIALPRLPSRTSMREDSTQWTCCNMPGVRWV